MLLRCGQRVEFYDWGLNGNSTVSNEDFMWGCHDHRRLRGLSFRRYVTLLLQKSVTYFRLSSRIVGLPPTLPALNGHSPCPPRYPHIAHHVQVQQR